jgi:hypothetical protein
MLVTVLLAGCASSTNGVRPPPPSTDPGCRSAAAPRDGCDVRLLPLVRGAPTGWPEDVAVFKEFLIEPVFAELQSRVRDDGCLVDVLQRVQLHAGRDDKTGVRAFQSDDEAAVRIDVGFIRELVADSQQLGSVLAARYDPISATHAGKTAALGDHLALLTTMDVVNWAVLHEIAHHRLGHARETSTSACLKQEELDADRLAFQWIARLGYSLLYVENYLSQRPSNRPHASQGEHPNPEERLEVLRDAFNAETHDSTSEWRTVAFVLPTDDGGQIMRTTLGPWRVPADMGTVSISRSSWKEDRIQVSSQSPWGSGQETCIRPKDDLIIKFFVAEPSAAFPRIRVEELSRFQSNWVQTWMTDVVAFPEPFSRVVGGRVSDSTRSNAELLKLVGAPPDRIVAASAAMDRDTNDRMAALYSFNCRGTSEAELEERGSALRRSQERELTELIGASAYQRLKELSNNSTSHFMIDGIKDGVWNFANPESRRRLKQELGRRTPIELEP